jgi:hypothetical protein
MTTNTHFVNTHLLKQLTKEQLIDLIEVTNKELRNRIVGENVKVNEPVSKPVSEPVESVSERRKRAIEFAKESIETLKKSSNKLHYLAKGRFLTDAKFFINKEKRTVVVLLKGVVSGDLYSKGVAKCDPSDVFNIHIGKAIALYRALDIEIPSLLLTAEHDSKVELGDIVDYNGNVYRVGTDWKPNNGVAMINSLAATKGKVIDDSKELVK